MLTSLSLDEHVSFIAENHTPPVFLCPVFLFKSPFVAFCLHCFCGELLFNRAVCFSPNLKEAPTNCRRAYFNSFSLRAVFMASLVFLGLFTLSRIKQTSSLGVVFLLQPHLPLRFGVQTLFLSSFS